MIKKTPIPRSAEQHYDIDKTTNEVRKYEILINGKVIRSASIKDIKRDISLNPSLSNLFVKSQKYRSITVRQGWILPFYIRPYFCFSI